ncbi:PREDICTED: probable sodium-coupled neutral amino acid transporter 6 isoform X1 [Nelumbo nucifera]|uniref:Probable sodium-coupled neutral amino acid transporter 6 isoform X1 n=1 Tax=Nelumbo nucifera TaxID=4432 RepID=A0A1U7ZRV9_NELNU|nr:PREDICTED: probable sodium-coupled neutral amino acid transporter 6 isoform X1 [Nelumbo nucifera]
MKMKWGNKDVETAVPLLPEFVSERNNFEGASVSGAVFNVSTTIVGAGIMSIPATMKVLGVIPAFILIFVIAVLSEISARFLLKYTHCGDSTTYAGVMAESFGRLGGLAVQICILITNIGALIIYLIIIGDVLSGSQSDGTVHLGVLQQWFGVQLWNTRPIALLFIVLFVLLPLVLLRRVESLRFTSAISVLLAVVFVGISAVIALSALWEGKTKTPRLLPDLVNQASFFDLFTAVPVIVTAFTFHFNVHPIGAELRRPCDMVSAVRISLILCSIIYCSVGFFGYLLFGDSIMSDILVNFDRNSGSTISSLLNDTVRLSYALHLVLVFPLLNFSLRANIDELLFAKSPILASDNNRFWALTCGLLGLIYIAAIAIPNIWYFFQFMGSTTAVCLAFIFPGAIVLRDVHEVSTGSDRISAAVMIVLAIVTSSIAISTNITNLTRSKL